MKLPEPLRPLTHRYFRVYWTGQAISFVGTWMQQMAQGWVVTRLSASATVLGTLTLLGTLPMAILGMKGGQLADRANRRNILIATQAIMGLLALALSGLAFTGHLDLNHLYAFALCLGLAAAFDLPAAQAFAPELVPREDIPRAVALMQAVFHGSRFVGPALAGIAIERYGEASAFFLNGVSFVAVIVSLLLIPAVRPGTEMRGRGGGGIGAGIGYIRQDRLMMLLLSLLVACMLLAFPFVVVLMAYYARYVLEAGAAGMGTIMSTSGLGAVLGSTVLVAVGEHAWRRRIGAGVGLIALSLTALGRVHTMALAVVFVALLSFGVSLFLGTIMQVVQERTPNEVRGRVMAVFTIGLTSLMPLSGFALSMTADAVGLPRLMVVCGILFGLVAGPLAWRLRSSAQAGTAVPDVDALR